MPTSSSASSCSKENDECFSKEEEQQQFHRHYPHSDQSSSSEEEEDDDQEENESLSAKANRLGGRGRRGTVMAAPLVADQDWTPPVYNKSIQEKESIKNTLVENVLFSALDDDSLEVVAKAMQKVHFEKNETIISQGAEDGDLFYVVEKGSCVVDVNGKEVMMIEGGVDSKRNYFGELALLYDSPRAATVIADTVVDGWALDRTTFRKILMNATIKKRILYKNFLLEVPILSTLTRSERLTLADALLPVNFAPNDVILKEGDAGDEFYLVAEGEVKCTQNDEEVSKRKVAGDYFGELALLTDDIRKATVTSVSDTQCLLVDRQTFKRLLGPLESLLRDNVDLYDEYVANKK